MNTTNLLLSSMVFFHHGDLIPAYEFTHYPCELDQIYVEGLEENNLYMISDNLYFYYDEPIFILNPNYTNFDVFDRDTDQKVGELNIKWKVDECDSNNQIIEDIDDNYTGIIAPDTIIATQNQEVNVLEDVYAFENGNDITHTLQSEDVSTEIPGSYISKIQVNTQDGVLEKEINVVVEEEKEVEDVKETDKLSILTKFLVIVVIALVVYLCVR